MASIRVLLMSLKIFCTSDLHLGMKFANYPDHIREPLVEARFKTLESLVEKANLDKCDILIIAGDLFDRISVAKGDITRAAQTLDEFQGQLVTVLPGNHDYIEPDKTNLWTYFDGHSGDRTLVIRERRVFSLASYNLDVNLYPGPCHAKHSSENAIGWIKDIEKDENVTYHVGIAHGSLKGFSPDFDKTYYPMTVEDLEGCGMDLWFLGHTHMQYPITPGPMDRIFYAGTSEPDGFGCSHEGKAWIVEIDEDKKTHARSISAGTFRFLQDQTEVHTIDDVEALKTRYASPEFKKTLLKLKIKGRIPEDAYHFLTATREAIEKQVFFLHWDDSLITREITPTDINKMFSKDSFPYTLLMTLSKKEEDFEALQEAYDLMNEVRK
jgi:exonuclease SbcD